MNDSDNARLLLPYFVDCIDAVNDAPGINPAQRPTLKITAANDVLSITRIITRSLKRGDLLVTLLPVIMLGQDIDDASSDGDDGQDIYDDNQNPAPLHSAILNCGFPNHPRRSRPLWVQLAPPGYETDLTGPQVVFGSSF